MGSHLRLAASLVSGLSDGALLLDRQLQVVVENRAALEILGIRRRALSAKLEAATSPFDVLGHPGAEAQARQCLEERRVISMHEVPFTLPDGEPRTAIVTFIPVLHPDTSESLGIVYLFRDVTAESRMQWHYTNLLANERARAADLERQVEQRTRELQIALHEVTRLARIDPLTGALNRRAFTEIAEEALLMADRHNRSLGLLLCDLDHFKGLNDTYGHQAGDAVLAAAVRALTGALRRTDKVCRFGGEEFVILLSETASARVLEIGDRCRLSIEALSLANLVDGAQGRQTASIGCAIYPDHGGTLDELINAADQALYHAKERGRNRVELYARQLAIKRPRRALTESSRVLLVHPDPTFVRNTCRALGGIYQMVAETSVPAANQRCHGESFDVFVASEGIGADSGIAFLRESSHYYPNAVRVLLTQSEDFSVAVLGTSTAHADHIVLERQGSDGLIRAIEDSLQWRQMARRRLLAEGPGAIRSGPRVAAPDLDALIDNEALDFVYQPIVGIDSGRIEGYEALCRPRGDYFDSPRMLVDAAVSSGKLWNLSRVMRRTISRRLADLPPGTSLFINLHPADLDDPALLDGESFLSPWAGRVVFEITERSWIPDFARCQDSVARLRQLGFSIAVDDLGSGYASLSSVALLEPQFVKIDMMLIHGIDEHSAKEQLVRRIVEFAGDAGIRVVAEGVETAQEAAKVAELGCHLMQGYHVGSPRSDFGGALSDY